MKNIAIRLFRPLRLDNMLHHLSTIFHFSPQPDFFPHPPGGGSLKNIYQWQFELHALVTAVLTVSVHLCSVSVSAVYLKSLEKLSKDVCSFHYDIMI